MQKIVFLIHAPDGQIKCKVCIFKIFNLTIKPTVENVSGC